MNDVLKHHYGPAEGPLGFPMTDQQAYALEAVLKALPRDRAYDYRRVAVEKGGTEVLPGERSDVSWITTEDPDRSNEVVLSAGMNDAQFRLNPLVTMQHAYWLPPVGTSAWRKQAEDGGRRGVKAKTAYPPRPGDWPAGADWAPDAAFELVRAGLLRGKSIGFLPVKAHPPTAAEVAAHGWHQVGLVIDEWMLLEYACCYLPCQQNAVVESVSGPGPAAGMKASGPPAPARQSTGRPGFTTADDLGRAVARRLEALDLPGLAVKFAGDHLDRLRGRV